MTGLPRAPGWTPYDGVAVTGWGPVGTVIRGQKGDVWRANSWTPSTGRPIRFAESPDSLRG